MKRYILFLTVFLSAFCLNAQKLTMGFLFPAGGQQGTSLEIEAGGLNLGKATKVIFSHTGIRGEVFPVVEDKEALNKRKKLNDQSSPQLADRVRIKIKIDKNVPAGMYDLRLQSPQGVSNKLPFEVSSYPNYIESTKSTLENPDIVGKLPAVLCGQVTPGGIDYFRFHGKKGMNLVASVKGRVLVPYIADAVPGWFQPVIRILDSKGHEVAYSDDYRHYVDPLVLVTLPEEDDYILYIHDAIYRGRQDFNYRIQLGEIPCITARYPSYGVVGKKQKQTLEGVNLVSSSQNITPQKEGFNLLPYKTGVGESNLISYYAVSRNVKYIPFPGGNKVLSHGIAVSDSLTSDSPVMNYTIKARKGRPVIVELIGRRNDSQIDAVMRLRNRDGRILATADDTEDPVQGMMTFHADPILQYTPKTDAELILEVEDLHGRYGAGYHYLLQMKEQISGFNAFVSPANISVPCGGTSVFRVDISGKRIKQSTLVMKGLPEGFTTSSMEIEGGKSWEVSVSSPKSATVGRIPVELDIEYPVRGMDKASQPVLPVDNMMQAFYYTHHIQASGLSLEVSQASPYRIIIDKSSLSDKREKIVSFNDSVIPLRLLIDKDADFNDTIELELGKKNKVFTLEPVNILPEEKVKDIRIKIDKSLFIRNKDKRFTPSWQMYIVGTVKGEIVKQGKRTFQNAKYREMTPIFMIRTRKE